MIQIINRQKKYPLDKKRFKRLFERLVNRYELEDPEVTLAFVNDHAIRELNRTFLGNNAATDVLSFPIGESGPDGKHYLGDVIISVPRASEQASAKLHSLERELEILAIHGFLHLLGFEHRRGMEEEEEKVRQALLEENHGHRT